MRTVGRDAFEKIGQRREARVPFAFVVASWLGLGPMAMTLPIGLPIGYMRYMRFSIPHMRNMFKGNPVPRPELFPVKKVIGFGQSQLSAIDKWRRRQTPIPSVSESIRQLVEQALARKGESPSTTKRPAHKARAARAAELAGRAVETKLDKSQPAEEQKSRKRKLLSGPTEFSDIRRDQPKR